MKIKIQYLLVVVFISSVALAQKKDENIGTEVVNVVKPYTPTISDAFKVKETPALEDEDNTKKEPIQYTIFPFQWHRLFRLRKVAPLVLTNRKKSVCLKTTLPLEPEITSMLLANCT